MLDPALDNNDGSDSSTVVVNSYKEGDSNKSFASLDVEHVGFNGGVRPVTISETTSETEERMTLNSTDLFKPLEIPVTYIKPAAPNRPKVVVDELPAANDEVPVITIFENTGNSVLVSLKQQTAEKVPQPTEAAKLSS